MRSGLSWRRKGHSVAAAHAYAPRPGWLAPGGEGGADSQVTGACVSVSSARGWLLEIFGRERDGRFLGVCNPGTAAWGLFGDLGLLSAHTCPRPAEHNRAPCGHGMYKDPKHRNDPVVGRYQQLEAATTGRTERVGEGERS